MYYRLLKIIFCELFPFIRIKPAVNRLLQQEKDKNESDTNSTALLVFTSKMTI